MTIHNCYCIIWIPIQINKNTRKETHMNQLNKDQMNVFARTIMPELYRLQKRYRRQTSPTSAVYHLGDPNDLALILASLKENGANVSVNQKAA